MLGLPPQAALSIISGIFLNLYAAVAFAAPLDMSPQQWSVLAVFLGICHSLIVENTIMKKLGIPNWYSYALRFFGGLSVAYITAQMPSQWFKASIGVETFAKEQYDNFSELISSSLQNSIVLSLKIILLITVLIFVMDWIKSLDFVSKFGNRVDRGFTIVVGVILGITYGAGVLIGQKQSGTLDRYDMFYIGTFLMICHAIIEDTLLFAMFGADVMLVITIRTVAAIIITAILFAIYKRISNGNSDIQ